MDDDRKRKILAKVRALQAKTVANGATEAEALAAAEKAAEILAEYGLSLTEADITATEHVAGQIFTGFKLHASAGTLNAIGRFCDVVAWHQKDAKGIHRHWFFGDAPAVQMAGHLSKMFKDSIDREFKAYKKGQEKASESSFGRGMAWRLSTRLDELTAAREAEIRRKTATTGTDLVLLRQQTVKSAFEEAHGEKIKLKPIKRRQPRNADDVAAGIQAAESVQIVRPIERHATAPALAAA